MTYLISVCFVQVYFIVMSSGNIYIYLAFMSRNKGKLFVLSI